MENIEKEIKERIKKYFINDINFSLYSDIQFYYYKNNIQCSVRVEKLNDKYLSPNIGDCTNINMQLQNLLYDFLEENKINQSFSLQISSPGVDRPLKSTSEWERFQEFPFKVVYYLENKKIDTKYLNYKGCQENQTCWIFADIKKNKYIKSKKDSFWIPKENLKQVSLYVDI